MSKFSLVQPVVYVTRDLERSLGLPLNTVNYYIISNFSPFAKSICEDSKNVLLIRSKRILDTWELLARPETKEFVEKIKNVQFLVFKPTTKIEQVCLDNGWRLLNPGAKLSSFVEEKISQVEWLGAMAQDLLPSFEIKECSKVEWVGKPFVLQFNFAHTGTGTILIKNKRQLLSVKKKFPDRPVRVTKYIVGSMFTSNNVVWGQKVLSGNISYQITGLKPFTCNRFATIGNDWSLPDKILTSTQRKEYEKIVQLVGGRLVESGWKGLFGVDVILEQSTGKLYLIEINARQPASASLESQLQILVSTAPDLTPSTTFYTHLCALLGVRYVSQKIVEIKTGAQLVSRVTEPKMRRLSEKKNLQAVARGFKIYNYNNIKPEADFTRFQISESLMAGHNELNELGVFLRDLIQ